MILIFSGTKSLFGMVRMISNYSECHMKKNFGTLSSMLGSHMKYVAQCSSSVDAGPCARKTVSLQMLTKYFEAHVSQKPRQSIAPQDVERKILAAHQKQVHGRECKSVTEH